MKPPSVGGWNPPRGEVSRHHVFAYGAIRVWGLLLTSGLYVHKVGIMIKLTTTCECGGRYMLKAVALWHSLADVTFYRLTIYQSYLSDVRS